MVGFDNGELQTYAIEDLNKSKFLNQNIKNMNSECNIMRGYTFSDKSIYVRVPIKRRSRRTIGEPGDPCSCATYTYLLEKGEPSKFLYLT